MSGTKLTKQNRNYHKNFRYRNGGSLCSSAIRVEWEEEENSENLSQIKSRSYIFEYVYCEVR